MCIPTQQCSEDIAFSHNQSLFQHSGWLPISKRIPFAFVELTFQSQPHHLSYSCLDSSTQTFIPVKPVGPLSLGKCHNCNCHCLCWSDNRRCLLSAPLYLSNLKSHWIHRALFVCLPHSWLTLPSTSGINSSSSLSNRIMDFW